MIAVVERAHHPVEHLGRPVEPQFLAELIRRVEALDESVWLHRRQCHAWRAAPAFQALLKIILGVRSEEDTSELQSLMRISYAVFCLKKKIRTYQPLIAHTRTRVPILDARGVHHPS